MVFSIQLKTQSRQSFKQIMQDAFCIKRDCVRKVTNKQGLNVMEHTKLFQDKRDLRLDVKIERFERD